jgi:hypothetical protein
MSEIDGGHGCTTVWMCEKQNQTWMPLWTIDLKW